MAAPPQLTSLNVEQAAGLTKEQREVYEKLGGILNPYLTDSVGALSRGLTFAENFAGQVRSFEFVMPADPNDLRTAWTAGTYQNSFTDWSAAFYSAEYRRDETGRVWLRGLVKTPAVAPAGYTPVLTLPTGFRPAKRLLIKKPLTGTTSADFEIEPTGEVRLSTYSAGGYFDIEASFATDTLPLGTTVRTPLGTPFPQTVTLERDFPGTPRYHVQLLAEDITDSKAIKPVAGVSFAWTPSSNGSSPGVIVTDVRGCVSSRKYRITALFLPE